MKLEQWKNITVPHLKEVLQNCIDKFRCIKPDPNNVLQGLEAKYIICYSLISLFCDVQFANLKIYFFVQFFNKKLGN